MNDEVCSNKTTRNEEVAEINKPTDDELADRWIEKHIDEVFGLGCFRKYDGSIWKGRSTTFVNKEIIKILISAKKEKIHPSDSKVNSLRNLIQKMIEVPESYWDKISNCLPLQNGLYDLSTLEYKPHNPDNFITSTLPYDYEPDAKPVFWLKALSPLPKDVVDFLQEYAGLCLTGDTHYEIAIWLYGPSGCGKSTIIAGFQAMLGFRCISLGLRDIEISRFNLSQVNGKTLMVSTEQPSYHATIIDIINKIISGENILADDKYGTPYQMTPHAKILWAMTELPVITSATNGIFRRVRIIEMPPLLEGNMDPQLKLNIMQEGPGILNWAIEGLKRLLERGCFQIPESVRLASESFKQNNDVPQQFVNECCEIGPNNQIQAQHLYDAYKRWCEDNGYTPMSMTKVAGEWERLGFTKSHSNGRNIWRRIKLKEFVESQGEEEKELINSVNGEVSTVSTPSTVSLTIPGEWFIPEIDNNQGGQNG